MADLSERQIRFCREYIIEPDPELAAVRAGYSPKTAEKTGRRILNNPAAIEYIEKEAALSGGVTRDFVLAELMKIASADFSDYVKIEEDGLAVVPTQSLDEDRLAAVASVRTGRYGVEVKTYDKLKALELIGKSLGMFAPHGEEDIEDMEDIRREVFSDDDEIKDH